MKRAFPQRTAMVRKAPPSPPGRVTLTGETLQAIIAERYAVQVAVRQAREQVEDRIAAMIALTGGAVAFRWIGWWSVAALVVYQGAQGVRLYRAYRRVRASRSVSA